MYRNLILTLIGEDRPGIVDSVSDAVLQGSGNWLESRMLRLAGRFTGILHIEIAADKLPALQESLQSLSRDNLDIRMEVVDGPAQAPGRTARLTLTCNDRKGIVKEITHTIAGFGINIEEIITDCISAPMTGDPLFQGTAVLRLDTTVDADRFRNKLEGLSEDIQVDLIFDP